MSDASLRTTKQDAAAARATLDELDYALRDATLEVVWRQWSAIGGMASARRRATSLVDPEALILMSLTLEHIEARLRDLLADWTARNSDLLSVQRMRNLAERYPVATRERLAKFAQLSFEEGRDHRWKPLIAANAPALTRRRNKARAIRVHPAEPNALVLRLRLAFGVGIKADLLGFLLGTDEDVGGSVDAITTATGYSAAAVRKAANDLVEARFVEETAGTRTEYHAPRAGWHSLLGLTKIPRWQGWNERFVFVAAFLEWAAEVRRRPLTPYVLESRGRELLEAHAVTFRRHRVWQQHSHMQPAASPSVLTSAVRALANWMEREA